MTQHCNNEIVAAALENPSAQLDFAKQSRLYSEILWVNCHRSRSTEAVSPDSLLVRMRLLWFWLEKTLQKKENLLSDQSISRSARRHCPLAKIKPHFQSCDGNALFLFHDFLLMSCQSNRGNLWEKRGKKMKSVGKQPQRACQSIRSELT